MIGFCIVRLAFTCALHLFPSLSLLLITLLAASYLIIFTAIFLFHPSFILFFLPPSLPSFLTFFLPYFLPSFFPPYFLSSFLPSSLPPFFPPHFLPVSTFFPPSCICNFILLSVWVDSRNRCRRDWCHYQSTTAVVRPPVISPSMRSSQIRV